MEDHRPRRSSAGTIAYDGSVDCGAGNGVAHVDRRDEVVGCERVIAPRSVQRRKPGGRGRHAS